MMLHLDINGKYLFGGWSFPIFFRQRGELLLQFQNQFSEPHAAVDANKEAMVMKMLCMMSENELLSCTHVVDN